jgi:hypothetical protein
MDALPELLAKVRLRHRSELFLVVDVDADRRVVELISISGAQFLVPNVPCAAIHELVEGPPDYL